MAAFCATFDCQVLHIPFEMTSGGLLTIFLGYFGVVGDNYDHCWEGHLANLVCGLVKAGRFLPFCLNIDFGRIFCFDDDVKNGAATDAADG